MSAVYSFLSSLFKVSLLPSGRRDSNPRYSGLCLTLVTIWLIEFPLGRTVWRIVTTKNKLLLKSFLPTAGQHLPVYYIKTVFQHLNQFFFQNTLGGFCCSIWRWCIIPQVTFTCSKSTVETLEKLWRCSGVFLLLTLNILHNFF